MADRVYPSAKPHPQGPAAAGNGGAPSSLPAPKSQMYQRPAYRPQQPAKRRRGGGRSCRFSCCCCFCWALLLVVLLALLAAVAGGAFYLLYRPQRPAFSVSLVRLTALNVSSSATSPSVTDSIDLTVTAKNPNKKLVYFYDDFAVTAATAANAVPLGDTSVPGFAHEAGNTTVIKATVAASAVGVDPTAASSDIKKSGQFPISVDLETKAGVQVGSLKTKKIGIQVHCDSIKVSAPPPPPAPAKKKKNGTAAAPVPVADDAAPVSALAHACQVRIRVKIWKWTF